MAMGLPGVNPSINNKTNSVTELRKDISHALEQRLTGLVKLSFSDGEELTMAVSHGGIRQAYFNDGTISKVLPNFWLDTQLSEKQAQLSILHLPARQLLFEKIILESDEATSEKKAGFKTSALVQLFSSLKGCEAGSLIHIQWENAEAFVFVPGSKIDLRPALFSCDGIVEEDASAVNFIEKWKEVDCNLVIYRGSIETEAWLEAHLDILFEVLCNYLLTQYGYLTGRVMVTSIIQNLMILAAQKGWEINRSGNLVVDQTVFTSPKEAAAAYQELLAMVLTHISAVIGSSLAQSLLKQGIYSYNVFYQSLIKTYELA
jgi:hypothetical protein